MEIKVKVIDKHTIELLEDAKAGDIINLNNISVIDNDILTNKLNDSFKITLENEIQNTKNKTLLEVQEQINKYNNEITLLKKEKEEIKSITITELNSKKTVELSNLENTYKLKEVEFNKQIELLNNKIDSIKETTQTTLTSKFNDEITELKEEGMKKLSTLEKEKNDLLLKQSQFNNEISLLKLELSNKDDKAKNILEVELIKNKVELESKFNEILMEKDKEISNLINQRAVKNIKQTGEDLEAWCDSEIKTYMQNGFLNCTWSKDNLVVKNEEDQKGSKADFIFTIFSNEEKEALLTNVCLEMKDENPDSINRKKNEDHFKQLDKNRIKKGCKYAVLVSNLELDKPNDLPMYKVNEYNDMYVVRPGYLMTFLNVLVSLSVKFKDLILKIEKEKIEFKASADLLEEFNSLKNTYLDKPLLLLEKEITAIKTASNSIIITAEKINKHCDEVKIKYLEEIENKLSKFNIVKLNKKADKI